MIAKGNGEVVSESDRSDDDIPSLIDTDSDCMSDSDKNNVLLAEFGESFVARRALNTQVSLEQRENISHTGCLVNGKLSTMIIDGGSCTNVACVSMVEKLNMACDEHPKPYRLQWLNKCGEFKVTRQVGVPFFIGQYKDEVICDVVPMQAGHLLLGRPWQF
jgi:hypothetical protein